MGVAVNSVLRYPLYRGKRLGRQINHSPEPRVEVEKEWSCTSTSSEFLHGVDIENFNFTSVFILEV